MFACRSILSRDALGDRRPDRKAGTRDRHRWICGGRTYRSVARFDASAQRYNRIVEENLQRVWRVARRCGVHQSELDDVIQEVFLVVARKLCAIDTSAERAFVAAVTVRVAANWRRAERRRAEAPMGWLENLASVEAPGYGPAERRQGLALLQQSLDHMTEAQRQVFILAELEEMTALEIASTLNLEEAAVVSRLRRSREVFRRFCENQQRGDAIQGQSSLGVG